jgi:3-phosphoshikimate 1-carboxyvinyltransferase
MGADLTWEVEGEEGGEPVGSITVRHSQLHGVTVDPALAPRLIDEVPALSVAATQAEGTTVFSGVGELRVKESDRLEGIASGLGALGADVEATDDGLAITGPTALTGGSLSSRGDHRLAMSFAVAGMAAKDDVKVQGWSAVGTSFPEFVPLVRSLRGRKKR